MPRPRHSPLCLLGRSAPEQFEQELARERAAALGRAGRKVEETRAACLALAERPDLADDVYRTALAAFEDARWAFCVQREALGLHDHTWVDRIYPPPPRRPSASVRPGGERTT